MDGDETQGESGRRRKKRGTRGAMVMEGKFQRWRERKKPHHVDIGSPERYEKVSLNMAPPANASIPTDTRLDPSACETLGTF